MWKTARVTDPWDERTEAIPGTKADKSFELDFDFAAGDGGLAVSAEGEAEAERRGGLSVVVFEPSPFGLSSALEDMGLTVRVGHSGVEVMGLVANDAPGAVICAPAPDAERRRLLAAALRLRFPNMPIVYVSTHAAQEGAILGALREGARAVLAWPLPSPSEVARVLEPFLASARGDWQLDTRPTCRPPGASPVGFDISATVVTVDEPLAPRRAPPRRPATAGHDFMADEPSTQPNMRPAAMAVDEARAISRGEIGELLAAVSPFLWSLEDASRWAAALGASGDPAAANHARTLMLLAKILGQLQARIDEVGA